MYLLTSVLIHMASITSAESFEEEDRLTWEDSPNGLFSMPSAYKTTDEVIIPWRGWDQIGN